jgi:UDP-N-acetylmuramoylalanine--D-glutamate ligase
MKHYVRAKRAIIDYQSPEGTIIMNLDNDMTRTIGHPFGAKVHWFSLEAQMAGGAGLVDDALALFDQDGRPYPLANKQELKLRGAHNLSNVLAACLMARQGDASIEAMRQVITTFTGVDHRLQLVRELDQVSYYNDSIATTPERMIAALHSFDEPIVLLAGGRDKHLPWENAIWLMLRRTRDVILFGEATETIAGVIDQVRQGMTAVDAIIHRRANLEEAVQLASQVAHPGDVVLLSPGCASFDAFRSFAERGERFKELVLQL